MSVNALARSATAFDTEAQLVSLFKNFVKSKVAKKSIGLLPEFECGDGRADLVFYKLRSGWESLLELGEVSPRWAFALRSLPYRRKFTTNEFAGLTLVSRSTAMNVLRRYESLGFCERLPDNDSWIKVKQPRQIVSQIYAVEAKLRHWQKALRQAARYRDYATQSWVLLDESSVKPAIENLAEFKRLNIGLAALSTKGRVTSFYEPTALPPKSELRFWQANAEIAQRMQSGH